MRSIVATTDVLAHESRFPKGTGFSVVAAPKDDAKPPQIDPRTAEIWLQNGWADEVNATAKAKPNAG